LAYLPTIQVIQAGPGYDNDVCTGCPLLNCPKMFSYKAFNNIALDSTFDVLLRYGQTQAVVV
jgi:hypothetical protein